MSASFASHLPGLSRRDGHLLLERPGAEPVRVTLRYLRPLTDPGALVLLDEKGAEVATVSGLDAFPPEERDLAREALAERYLLPVILRVERVDVRFGTRYWWVETDRGPRWFALREPGKNVVWVTPTRLVLRDTAGNRYQIPDLQALDPRSRRWVGVAL